MAYLPVAPVGTSLHGHVLSYHAPSYLFTSKTFFEEKQLCSGATFGCFGVYLMIGTWPSGKSKAWSWGRKPCEPPAGTGRSAYLQREFDLSRVV